MSWRVWCRGNGVIKHRVRVGLAVKKPLLAHGHPACGNTRDMGEEKMGCLGRALYPPAETTIPEPRPSPCIAALALSVASRLPRKESCC